VKPKVEQDKKKISKHISKQSSGARQARAGLMHSTKRYHSRCSYRSRRIHDNAQQSLAM